MVKDFLIAVNVNAAACVLLAVVCQLWVFNLLHNIIFIKYLSHPNVADVTNLYNFKEVLGFLLLPPLFS